MSLASQPHNTHSQAAALHSPPAIASPLLDRPDPVVTTQAHATELAGPPWGITLVILLFLVLGVIYSISVPIFEAPDELHHYFYVRHLASGNALPVQDPEADQPWAQEGSQPPLYYALAGLVTSWIPTGDALKASRLNWHANVGIPLEAGNKNRVIHSPLDRWPYKGTSLAVHVARWFSLLLAAGTILCTYVIARRLLPERPYVALMAAAVNAFTPQFVFIGAAVTNDNLVILLAALTVLQLVSLLHEPHTKQRLILLGVTLGLAALTKLSGLGLAPLAVLILLIQNWREHRLRDLPRDLSLMLLPILLVAGWWYLRNWQLYGDATGLNVMLQMVGPRLPPPGWAQLPSEFQGLRISFWGLFGWFNVPFPHEIYLALDWLSAVTALGLVVGMLRLTWRLGWQTSNGNGFSLRDIKPLYWVLLLLSTWIAIITAALVRWTRLTPGTQGRLIFPAMPALAILLILSWSQLAPISGRFKKAWLSIWPAFLLVLTLAAPSQIIGPAYAPPPQLTIEDIPASAALAEPIQFGIVARLLGVEVTPDTVQPNDEVEITFYWEALTEVPYDLSLFIRLLGRDHEVIGQLDTYPGWGGYATSVWQEGDIFQDRYRVAVDWDAVAPSLVRVDMGLYYAPTLRTVSPFLPFGEKASSVVGAVRLIPGTVLPVQPQQPGDFDYNGLIALRGYDYSADALRPGEPLTITFYWQDVATMSEDLTIFVHLLGPDGLKVTQYDRPPLNGEYPTSLWRPGDVVVDSYTLILPEDASPGLYRPLAGFYLPATLERVLVGSQAGQVQDRGALLKPVNVSILPGMDAD